MKIVHISTLQDGGSALCAIRLCKALRALGHDSQMLTVSGQSSEFIKVADADSPTVLKNPLRCKLRNLSWRLHMSNDVNALNGWLRKIRNKRKDGVDDYFHLPVTYYSNIIHHPLVEQADIIHLHWISDFVDYPTFFSQADKPIVWTMHDEAAGLVGQHYLGERERLTPAYRSLVKKCEGIVSKAYREAKNLSIVTLSAMMRDYAGHNELLRGFNTTMIHNGVDTEIYHPIERDAARERLDIPKEKMVILFSSASLFNPRKGFDMLIRAIEGLEGFEKDNILIVALGETNGMKADTRLDIRYESFISDESLLAYYYSAADFFVNPSRQEAFAQTPLESMSCGTPVISFPYSGAHDLIDESNGVVCDDFTVDSLCKAIGKAMDTCYDRRVIREYIAKDFSWKVIAEQYCEFYESLKL